MEQKDPNETPSEGKQNEWRKSTPGGMKRRYFGSRRPEAWLEVLAPSGWAQVGEQPRASGFGNALAWLSHLQREKRTCRLRPGSNEWRSGMNWRCWLWTLRKVTWKPSSSDAECKDLRDEMSVNGESSAGLGAHGPSRRSLWQRCLQQRVGHSFAQSEWMSSSPVVTDLPVAPAGSAQPLADINAWKVSPSSPPHSPLPKENHFRALWTSSSKIAK